MNPEQARTAWLEREVAFLQSAMKRLETGRLNDEYWGRPVRREPFDGEPGKGDASKGEAGDVLPKLSEVSSRTASLEAGDWLAQLRPLIGDVSEHATEWWDGLINATVRVYRTWLA